MTILSRPGDCQFHMSLHKFIVEPSFFYLKAAQWQFCQAAAVLSKANSHFISADCHFVKADGRFAAILSQANGRLKSADGHVIKADGRFIKRRPSCQRPMAILSVEGLRLERLGCNGFPEAQTEPEVRG